MITEKEYLEAVAIVRQYHSQVESSIREHESEAKGIVLNKPSKGDRIVITQAFGASKYLTKGSEHIVSWSRVAHGNCIIVKLSTKGTGRKKATVFNTDNYSFEIIEKYPIVIP